MLRRFEWLVAIDGIAGRDGAASEPADVNADLGLVARARCVVEEEIVRIRVKGPASVSPWAEEPVASAGDKDILMTVDNRVASDWMDCSALARFEVVESGRVAVMVHGDEVREISTLVVCDVHIKQVADVRTDKGLA